MSETTDPHPPQSKSRPVGATEHSWCKAVPIGTGITVLALLLSKPPDFSLLQTALHKLQITHPILRSTLHFDPTTSAFSLSTPPPSPPFQIQPSDLPSTANASAVSPFHLILEHELNENAWRDMVTSTDCVDIDVFFARVYVLSEGEWALTLRLHTAACDRTGAVGVLRELMGLMGGGVGKEIEREGKVNLGIEECIPSGKANKPFWARGVDMLGYSLNSFRFSNLEFVDADSPRCSQVVRLWMSSGDTDRIVSVSLHCGI